MQLTLSNIMLCMFVVLSIALSPTVSADNLTQAVQKDLVILGYDPGNISGEATTATAIAIAKFQADNNIEVTGEVTPQLAGSLSTAVAKRNGAAIKPAGAQDPEALKAAQQACLQEKIAEAEAKKKKRRGFGSLMTAVGRTAGQLGNESVAQTAGGVVAASDTAADLSSAARDLGVTDDEIAACENPM